MVSVDIIFFFISCTQPILVGVLAYIGLGRSSSWVEFFKSTSSLRSKVTNYRVYECATPSRLNNLISFNLSFFSIMLTFLIYDVDLVFFASELLLLHSFGFVEAFILFVFFIFLVLGLVFEAKQTNFNWKVS